MSIVFDQVESCLRVYWQRGIAALSSLEQGEQAKAEESLKWRRAAYYNFLFYDERAQGVNADYLLEDRFQKLWPEIREVDRKLTEFLESERQNLKADLQKTNHLLKNIKRFHSGREKTDSFRKTV